MTEIEYLPYGKDKIGRAVWECLKRMYKEATPSADIEKIAKSGEGKMPDFFMGYLLSQKREVEIINEVCKEFKLKGIHKKQVSTSLWMGCAPTSAKEVWKKGRKDYEERLKKYLRLK